MAYARTSSTKKITGLKELAKTFEKAAGRQAQERMLRKAARTAFQRVFRDAKSNAPKDPNSPTDLATSMRMRTKILNTSEVEELNKEYRKQQKKSTGSIAGAKKVNIPPVGIKITVGTGKATEHYALFVEFGVDAFIIEKTSVNGKKFIVDELVIEEKPFMRPALYSNKDYVIGTFVSVLRKEIAKEFKKNANKG